MRPSDLRARARSSDRRQRDRARRKRLRDALIVLAAATYALAVAARDDAILDVSAIAAGFYCRKGNDRRESNRCRLSFWQATMHLTDIEFSRAFRMSRTVFANLLARLEPYLRVDEAQAWRSSGGPISAGVRLGVGIRLLCGASCCDMLLAFGISRPAAYNCLHEVIECVNKELPLPGIPFDDSAAMHNLAQGFATSRTTGDGNPLYGCIAALDGIAVAIKKPSDEYNPASYFTRKGFYALPVQATVDSKYRFRTMSITTVGATHDSLSFATSFLGIQLEKLGRLIGNFFVAGDAAYMVSENLLVPYCKAQLSCPEYGVARDAFNYFQSSHRVHIEQAFGILVRRFGILWKPLEFALPRCGKLISATMALHNFLVDSDGVHHDFIPCDTIQQRERTAVAWKTWWRNASESRDAGHQGFRSDCGVSKLRDDLADNMLANAFFRPYVDPRSR